MRFILTNGLNWRFCALHKNLDNETWTYFTAWDETWTPEHVLIKNWLTAKAVPAELQKIVAILIAWVGSL